MSNLSRLVHEAVIESAVQDRNWIVCAVAEYEVALVRYAMFQVGDVETARDVVQDTFLRLCRQSPEDVTPHLKQWLYKVCRNLAIDVCRKESRMKLAKPTQLEMETGNVDSPFQQMQVQERHEELTQQISRLPKNQQEVLRLKFHGGLSYVEIAEVTGLTPTNVGFLLHTAISKLRSRIR